MDGPYYTAGAAIPDPGPVHLALSPAGGTSTANLRLNAGTAMMGAPAEPTTSILIPTVHWHDESHTQPLLSVDAIPLVVALVFFAILRRLQSDGRQPSGAYFSD
ncbi:MAG: hypothetical protein ACXVUL_10820 [Solirubrobacteraceae bacterium]